MRDEDRPPKRARRAAPWKLDHPYTKEEDSWGSDHNQDNEVKPAPKDEDSEREWDASQEQQQPLRRKKKKKRLRGLDARVDAPVLPGVDLSDDVIEHSLAFCCKVCRCSTRKRNKLPNNDMYITPGANNLWHRRCCHNEFVGSENWISPFTMALTQAEHHNPEFIQGNGAPVKEIPAVKYAVVRRRYDHAKTLEAEMYNDDELEHPVDMLRTNPQYVRNETWFNSLTRQNEPKRAAVVIDAFGGIGGAIVALKRLGIAISKILHIEQDKVANHVYKHWHDVRYNPDLPEAVHGNIEHVYYRRFETFEENIDEILVNHGPFDIIVGGPPCVDYSGVNANSKGTEGVQGSYLPRFGKLIKKINRRMVQQRGHPTCFYLAENSALRDNLDLPIDKGDLSRIKEAFGIDWDFCMDSKDVSPLRRKRTYISNIPLMVNGLGDHLPNTCFDDSFDVAGHLMESDMMAKANCLMAHKGRLDDERMEIYKEGRLSSGQRVFAARTPTVVERERLMGFREGYVSEPKHGFMCEYGTDAWEDKLKVKYHTFSGDYHRFKGKYFPFRFVESANPVQLMLAPPMDTKTPEFYTSEQYSKRLLGNSFSIPTLEALLAPLRMIFASRDYPAFQYNFSWAPYGEGLRDMNTKTEASTAPSDGHTTVEDPSVAVQDQTDDNGSDRARPKQDPEGGSEEGEISPSNPAPRSQSGVPRPVRKARQVTPDGGRADPGPPSSGETADNAWTSTTRRPKQEDRQEETKQLEEEMEGSNRGTRNVAPEASTFDPETEFEELEV